MEIATIALASSVLCLALCVLFLLLRPVWAHVRKARAIALDTNGLVTTVIPIVAFGSLLLILSKLILF